MKPASISDARRRAYRNWIRDCDGISIQEQERRAQVRASQRPRHWLGVR